MKTDQGSVTAETNQALSNLREMVVGSQDNKVVSSKYTLLTFLPLNIYHQLTKASTMFFFITLILISIPAISPFEPWTYLIAFLIVVGISMVKDGIEDYKRHKSDRTMNEKKSYILVKKRAVSANRGSLSNSSSENSLIRNGSNNTNSNQHSSNHSSSNNTNSNNSSSNINLNNSNSLDDTFEIQEKPVMSLSSGDWLLLRRNEEVPADVVLMKVLIAKEDRIVCGSHCFVDTSNLDGESNLKKRNVPDSYECNLTQPTRSFRNISADSYNESTRSSRNLPADNHNETSYNQSAPSTEICQCFVKYHEDLNSFNLKDTGDSFSDFQCELFYKNKSCLATEKNVLLRGSILKNTERAVCLVVGVGNNTKQCKSVCKRRKGRSIFEKQMDYILILVFVLYVFMLIVTTSIGSYYIYRAPVYENYKTGFGEIVRLMFSNYILYSYLIPLSLYVMVEVARFIHTSYIKYDRDLEINGVKSICRNSNVIEDLGMIDYILADKTGTITKNAMTLKAVHSAGNSGLLRIDEFFESELFKFSIANKTSSGSNSKERRLERKRSNNEDRLEISGSNINMDRLEMSGSNNNADTLEMSGSKNNEENLEFKTNSNDEQNASTSETIIKFGHSSENVSAIQNIGKSNNDGNENINVGNENVSAIQNEPVIENININDGNFTEPRLITASIRKLLSGRPSRNLLFLINILVCNSVEVLNGEYEGISQDELCFLDSLRKYGFELIKRDENYVKVRFLSEIIKIDILYTLEFTSKRQSMSMIVKLFGKYYLFSKGSDQMLLDKSKEDHIIDIINKSSDYRSLVIKYKELTVNDIVKIKRTIEKKLRNKSTSSMNTPNHIVFKSFVSHSKDKSTFRKVKSSSEEVEENCHKNDLNFGGGSNDNTLSNTSSNMNGNDMNVNAIGDDSNSNIRNGNDSNGNNSTNINSTNKNTNNINPTNKNNSIDEDALTEYFMDQRIKLTANDEIFNQFNNDLIYLGSTFIEDQLQDGVHETIGLLKSAGIRIWMVTGDKKETAISCGRNSGIISNGNFKEYEGKMALEEISQFTNQENLGMHIFNRGNIDQRIQGNDRNIFDYNSVIIYRATPSQKARIAEMLVNAGKYTLAVGDGNNDVGMLKDAHVGVGILGKEGTQASLAADFAIPEFKALKKLILVHGKYNLMRYSKMALNAFYKNIFFIFVQFFFNLYNGASGKSIYNGFFLNYYNLFFTSMVPFSIALFDRDIPEQEIVEYPQTYRKAREYFDRKFIYLFISFAIIEAAIVFFLLRACFYWDISDSSGKIGGYSCLSTIFSIVVFMTVIFRQYRTIGYFVVYNYIAVVLSVVLIFIMLFGIQELADDINYTIYHILQMPITYFIMLEIMAAVYMIDTIFDYVQQRIFKEIELNRKIVQ